MQDLMFKNFIIPFYNKYKRFNRLKYYLELKKRNLLSIDELLEIQERKLKLLVNHCYENIPYYQKLFKNSGIHPSDIKTLKDYSQIPELKKQNIRDNYNLLIDPNLPKGQLCYSSTGGSTGIPVKIYKSCEDQEYGFALRYRSNAWCGWKIWHKSLWIVSDLKRITELDTKKRRLGLWLKRRLMLDTKNWNKDNMFRWVRQIKDYKPLQVYGYSSLLTEFSKFLLENNIKIEGIKGVYSTAEPLVARELISQAFAAPVHDQYGSSEIPCIAHECKKGNMHINIDEVLVEFVSVPGSSELRKIVCTPLYVYGMPLLRYELGDTAIPNFKKCDCGLPYPVMELKVGRIADNFISPNENLVSTCAIGWHIAQSTFGIKQFQIIQEDISEFTVRLVSSMEHKEENEEALKEILYDLLGTNMIDVKFEYVEAIEPGSNGKIRSAISHIMQKTN